MSKRRAPRPQAEKTAPQEVTFRAGCGRTWPVLSLEPDLAYTALVFPECPSCPQRVEPEGGPPFCTLRPVTAAHPFAALADFSVEDG